MTKRGLLVVFLVAVVLLTSCGGGGSNGSPTPPARAELLYVTTTDVSGATITTQLASFKVDTATGALSATGSSTASDFLLGLAVDPAAKFLYASDLNPPATFIDTFSVTPATGAPVPASALLLDQICVFCPVPSAPGTLALAPGGRTLYYASSTPFLGTGVVQGIGALRVSSDGSLSVVSGSPFPADLIPFTVVVHPSGKFAYTANVGPITGLAVSVLSISCYLVDPMTGALNPIAGSPFPVSTASNASFQSLVIHPSGKYLYLTTGSAANGVLGWRVDPASGSLTPLSGSPFVPGAIAGGGAFDPTGRFFYSGGNGGTISAFSTDPASGALAMVSSSSVLAGASFSAPVVDTSGKFLFVGDGPHKSIVSFRLDSQTGGLSVVGSPTSIGGVPGMLAITNAP